MNEEDNIKPLLEQVYAALEGIDYEVIVVDDGSTDNTIPEIRKYATDRVKLVEFMKNYGQSNAMAAGLNEAQGEYVAAIDGDLQNDPSDIPMMLKMIEEEGHDMVAGNRKNRQDGAVMRKLPSKMANSMIRYLTGVKIRDYGCTLKIMSNKIAKGLGLYGELHRFIPVLAKLNGAKSIVQVDVKHHARIHGESKYGIGRTFRVISDLILVLFFQKYLPRPMHLFGLGGVILFLVGMVINLYLLVIKIMGQDIWGKPLLILGAILVIGGIQLIMTGIIIEVLMRTYYESQNKTTYQIRNIFVGKE